MRFSSFTTDRSPPVLTADAQLYLYVIVSVIQPKLLQCFKICSTTLHV